jgi:hypothetical protein
MPRKVQHALPKKLVQQLFEDHGRDTGQWNQELQDLVDASISAKQLNPPISGQIKLRKNRDFEYFWAKDVCGEKADHSRVEELRAVGFDFATTKDVDMATNDTVKGRDAKGFTNEIRSGDRRLLKVPMMIWRELRKAQNVRAINTAYPQHNTDEAAPMSTALLDHNTRLADEQTMEEWAGNRVVSDPRKEISTGVITGNAVQHRVNKEKRA